jgi:molybdopterin molybdotransferase
MPGDIKPEHMPAGSIYNSNRFFLRALLLRAGCSVTDFGIVPGNSSDTLKVLTAAAQEPRSGFNQWRRVGG